MMAEELRCFCRVARGVQSVPVGAIRRCDPDSGMDGKAELLREGLNRINASLLTGYGGAGQSIATCGDILESV